MATTLKATGSMTKRKVMVPMNTFKAQNMLETGKTINSTASGLKIGLMALISKVLFKKDKNTDTESSNGPMAPPTLALLK